MRGVKINKKPNLEKQTIPPIPIGRGKEECYSLRRLLQDVFSDSGNASGTSQKTPCPSDAGQGKWAQLGGKGSRKPRLGGRNLSKSATGHKSPARKKNNCPLEKDLYKRKKLIQ